jgi:thiol-disulfide isomerase/thioredoxin
MIVIERALLSVLLLTLALVAYRLFNAGLLRRRTRLSLQLPDYQPGRPAVLYFTMPYCAPCDTVQAPALRDLQTRFGDGLQVIEIDASRSPDQADHWGVLSVPTTFIIDVEGRPRGVNHGVARADKLERQLAAIGIVPPTQKTSAWPAVYGVDE